MNTLLSRQSCRTVSHLQPASAVRRQVLQSGTLCYNQGMIYLLYGTDESRIRQKKRQLKEKYPETDSVVVDCLQPGAAARLEQALDTADLFASRKLIFADNATFLCAKNTSQVQPDAVTKRLETDDVLVLSVKTEKLDKRKKAVKMLEQAAQVIPCLPLDGPAQKAYVQELMKEKQLELDPDSFNWFCSHAGCDPVILESEIEKLSVFDRHPSLEDVKALTTVEPVSNVFIMTDALFDKNGLRLLAAYRNFRDQNMEPLAVVMLLAGQIRFLFQVRVLMDQGKGKQEIAKTLSAHPYRTQIAMGNARRFDSLRLMDLLEQMAHLEQGMKKGQLDKDQGFEMFCLDLMQES